MITAGLDIGSRTVALVEWDGECIVGSEVINTGTDPIANSLKILNGLNYTRLIATGYGRHLAVDRKLANEVITEIKAYAIGAHKMYPDVQTVLDIGGQDTKVIQVKPDGRVSRFEMNDRCAAGTGRFLENMATALGLSIEQLSAHALEAKGKGTTLSSMCTVFAESEVVSLIGRGEDSHNVALGIHQSIVNRVTSMIRRIGIKERFVFAGGVARNRCMHDLLCADIGISLDIPENPQILGALGAAIYGFQD
jgi:(R)-2-hydroxyacyl-CoA dehydratese activating ATPase